MLKWALFHTAFLFSEVPIFPGSTDIFIMSRLWKLVGIMTEEKFEFHQ